MATATTSTLTYTTPANNGSVTSVKPISDMLNSLASQGVLTKTADTGQVDWGSVANNATSQTQYEIFKLNDSQNAAAPIYLQFNYVFGTSTFIPSCTVVIGTGSDGAGTLTGATSAAKFRGNITSSADNTQRTAWASAGEGYLTLFGGAGSNTPSSGNPGSFALVIERFLDSSGNITPNGVVVSHTSHISNNQNIYLSNGSSFAASTTTNLMCFVTSSPYAGLGSNLFTAAYTQTPPIVMSGISNGNGGMIQNDGTNFLANTIQPWTGTQQGNPMTAFMISQGAGWNNGGTVTMSMYGTPHVYRVAPGPISFVMPGFSTLNVSGNITVSSWNIFHYNALFRYE